ncbi:PepSY domain-containing protein [Bacillus sp. FJAT-29790]|nr:PepSY domain-containing protein [Bacillus sp. FJAT-29790]
MTRIVTSAKPLTADEASKLVQDRYNGNVVQINEQENQYQITIELETGTYVVEINRDTGDISSLTRTGHENQANSRKELTEAEINALIHQQQQGEIKKLEKKTEADGTYYYALVQDQTRQITYKINALNGETVNSTIKEITEPKESVKSLTKEDAIKIALKNVSGEVDDVSIEQSNGLTYYLVEIDRKDDNDATVQINSISGEVMSITWED